MLRVKFKHLAKLLMRVNTIPVAVQGSKLPSTTSRLDRRAVRPHGGQTLRSTSARMSIEPTALRSEHVVNVERAVAREVNAMSVMCAQAMRDGVDNRGTDARRRSKSAADNGLNQVNLAVIEVAPVALVNDFTHVRLDRQ